MMKLAKCFCLAGCFLAVTCIANASSEQLQLSTFWHFTRSRPHIIFNSSGTASISSFIHPSKCDLSHLYFMCCYHADADGAGPENEHGNAPGTYVRAHGNGTTIVACQCGCGHVAEEHDSDSHVCEIDSCPCFLYDPET